MVKNRWSLIIWRHALSGLIYSNVIQGSWTHGRLGHVVYIFRVMRWWSCFRFFFFFPPSQADDFQYFRHWGKVFSCLRKTVGGFTSHLAEWLQEGVMEARRGRMEVDSLEVSRVGQSCFLCRHVGQSGRAGQSGGAGLQVGTELSACTSQQVNCLQKNRHGSGLCHTPDWAGRGNRVINVKHSEGRQAEGWALRNTSLCMVGWLWSREINAMAGITGIQRILELLFDNTLMLLKTLLGTSAVILWIRISRPTQDSWMGSLARDDSACRGAESPCATPTEQML